MYPCTKEPDLFFPVHGEPTVEKEIRKAKAKALCAGCENRRPCLELGLQVERETLGESRPSTFSAYGIWGGLERRQLLKILKAQPAA